MAAKMNLDGALMKRILTTHQREDVKKFDPSPLLHAIKDVIQSANGSLLAEGCVSFFEGDLLDKLQDMAYEAIKSVSCEFSCKCSGASTTSEVAIGVLQSLGNYSWEAKAVITLAAFAANYGSYFSISQLCGSNARFSKSMAFLQLSPNLLKQTPLKLKPKALEVVEAILGLTNYIVEIKDFQSKYVQRKNLASIFAVHKGDLAKAVYISIRSTVACASILMNTVAFGNEYQTTEEEAQELSALEKEIKDILSQMESSKKYTESLILAEDYENLVNLLKREHTDNIKILQALLCSNQSQSASIYHCSTKTQVELNKFSGKHVVLHFSNLEYHSKEETSIISEKYASKSTLCEIVWVPIVDKSTSRKEEIRKSFKEIQDSMEWYSINDPWKLNKAVIKFAKKEWKFEGKSEIVVLSPKGKFVMSAAVNLFWFLERSSFKLNYWKTIQLLEETMGSVNDWIKANKHIILFGGKDIEWIKKFVGDAQRVMGAAKIEFVMVYVEKSNLKWEDHQSILQRLQKDSNTKAVSGLGDQKRVSSFWATLQSIWLTKIKTGKSIADSSTMDNIFTLLSFDGSGEKWAAICRDSSPEVAIARGETILDILKDNTRWEAIRERAHGSPPVCCNLDVAATTESTPKMVKCVLCDRAMKTFISYRCCGDH